MGIVEEEADESIYWMELLVESELMQKKRIEDLMDEADQLVSIVVSSINTARGNKRSGDKRD
ncbi:MAG: four helix bundle protein, partial [Blastocatellia bacterium]